MKQVVQHLRNGATRVVDVPVPRPTPGTVLVRTAVSVLSAGTERMVVDFAGRSLVGKARARPDLVRQTLDKVRKEGVLPAIEAVRARLDEPLALGYASAGTIVEVGDGVDSLRPGDRVACAGGGYAVHGEYAVIPKNLVARLPENVDFESAAFATLGAIALHALRLGRLQIGERVAVVGLGLLGLLTAALARAAGATVLGVDLDRGRVRLARALGAAAHTRPEAEAAARAASGGVGFDLIVICADGPSNDPVTLAAALARDRARVVAVGAVGLDLPRKAYYEKELEFIVSRSYGPGRYDPSYEEDGRDYPAGYVRWTEGRNLQSVVDLIGEGRLDVHPLISHRFPIERAVEAYALLAGGGPEVLGVLLTYPLGAQPTPRDRLLTLRPASASNEPVRLGAIGAGSFATAVAFPALRRLRGVEFVGVATASGLSAAHAGSRFGFRYATTDESKILGDPEVNTLAVFTRHHLHARLTAAGLRAGKHVFCEKPLALTKAELDDVAEALADARGMLTVGFNRRFAPLALRLKGFMEAAGAPLAMLYRINAGPLPADHWLRDLDQGGGRLIGEVCHFIDLMTFLAGSPPVRVEARGLQPGSADLEDSLLITVGFAGGGLGSIAYLANGDRSFEKERLEVFGAGRVAVLDDFRRLETSDSGRRRRWTSPWRQDKGHRALWQAFVDAIRLGGPPPIPYSDVMAVSKATIAASLALQSGEAVDLAAPFAGA